jgi:Carboxypeptidase regulatory-like domain
MSGRVKQGVRILEMMTRVRIGLVSFLGMLIVFGIGDRAVAQDDEGPTSAIKVVVVSDAGGKPIKNAAVVLHPVNKKGKATKGEIDLKTDADGRASIDGIPYGSIEVQVLSRGFQTYGENFEVKQATTEITVKLKRPSGQYSIYENHDDKKDPEQKPQ